MAHFLTDRLKSVLKAVKVDQLYYYVHSRVYLKKVAVTTEKDLSSLRPVSDSLAQAGVKLVPITPEVLTHDSETAQTLIYSDEQRLQTARSYLRKGYCGIALVSGKEVSGDIWYSSARFHQKGVVHPDLRWLRLECGVDDAYAFDMYVYPGKRGKNVANMLQSGALHEIRKHGYTRALGYYWAENIPALWVHRTLQWNELKRLRITRFLCLHHCHDR